MRKHLTSFGWFTKKSKGRRDRKKAMEADSFLQILSGQWRLFFCSKLGDGSKIKFLKDVWIGGMSFKDYFPKNFKLSNHNMKRMENVWNSLHA